jgi:hypothetical protein
LYDPTSAPLPSREDRQVELAESPGVGEEVELNDLAVPDGDDPDRERLAVEEADRPGNAVDQRRPDLQVEPRVAEGLARDRLGAADLLPPGRPEIAP